MILIDGIHFPKVQENVLPLYRFLVSHYKWCSIHIQDTDVGDIFLQEIGSADIGFQDPLSWQNMGGQYDVRKVWLFV